MSRLNARNVHSVHFLRYDQTDEIVVWWNRWTVWSDGTLIKVDIYVGLEYVGLE